MLERDGYPPGVPCWIDTGQPDPEAAVAFYRGVFGWEFEDRMPPDSPGRYFVAQLRGRDVAAVGTQPEAAPRAPVWNTYIWVESADATAAKVTAAGGNVLSAPFDVLDAGRMGVFSDPSGAVFCAWQANQHKGAQIVNEPATWNWSNLNTRDPEGATAFYSTVFGWAANTVDFGFGESTMWCVPGYAEFLEVNEPGLRRRQAEAGVPAGFADCIAWMAPMTSDQFSGEVPPHWSVTFAVDDTDATVDRAAQLGGKVVVPPYDAGPVRIAGLSDPQGAGFTVSKYQPG